MVICAGVVQFVQSFGVTMQLGGVGLLRIFVPVPVGVLCTTVTGGTPSGGQSGPVTTIEIRVTVMMLLFLNVVVLMETGTFTVPLVKLIVDEVPVAEIG